MAAPYSADTLIDYAFRRLGSPVIDINVDRQQAEERLDDALQYFSERHFDGVEKHYYSHKVTGEDRTNGFINLNGLTSGSAGGYTGAPAGSNILTVNKVMPFGSATSNMFNVLYQMSLHDYFGINRSTHYGVGLGLASYDSTKSFINLVEQLFDTEKNFRFSKVTNKLYVDMNWEEDIDIGDFIFFEAYAKLDPVTHTEIYNDRLLKEYVTALIKRQWGANLSKFDGVQLPGGVTIRGAEIFSEANEEVRNIEERVLQEYELPVDFFIA